MLGKKIGGAEVLLSQALRKREGERHRTTRELSSAIEKGGGTVGNRVNSGLWFRKIMTPGW